MMTRCGKGLLLPLIVVVACAFSVQAALPAYVINNGSGSLTIIDMSTRQVTGQISAGNQPAEMLIMPDNHYALLTLYGSNTLLKLNLRTNSPAGTATVGTAPGSLISPDGRFIYVANEGSNNVTVVDYATMTPASLAVNPIPVGTTPIQVNARGDGQFIYVVNQGSNSISVISAATQQVISAQSVGAAPNQFAIHPAGQRAFIPNTAANTVSVFDMGSNTVVSTISSLTGRGPGIIAFSPDGNRIFVLESSGVVDIFDNTSLRRLGSIPVAANPVDMAITSDGLYAYVACQGAGQVFVVDLTNLANIQSDPISMGTGSQPASVTFDNDENYVYVVLTGANQVALIDTNTDFVVNPKLAVGAGPVGFEQLNQPWVRGVVNGASFTPGMPIAGGAIVSLFGEGLVGWMSQDQDPAATSFPLPTTMPFSGGTQVTFNGVAAPLFFVSGLQINVQVPSAMLGLTSATLEVTAPNGDDVSTVSLAPVSPGIFALNAQGTGPGAILHDDSTTLVTAANPARAGETVVIFVTGLGQTSPPITDGQQGVNSKTNGTVTVSVGGLAATVQYAGQAPGFAGLYQVNAVVPASLTTGTYNVAVGISGVQSNTVTSNTVTLAVR